MIYPDQIIRSDRKTLSISIDARGRLVVRAPLRYSDERIFSFLEKKRGWIDKQRKKLATRPAYTTPVYLNGFSFPLLGRTATVRLYDGDKVLLQPQTGELFVPTLESGKKLVDFLKKTAKTVFLELASEWAKRMKTSYPKLTVTSAKTRWGSCSGNNALHFSFRLLYAPKEAIEYVIVHELAHTFHKNHGAGFWKTVEKFMPDYAWNRDWLKNNASLMQIL